MSYCLMSVAYKASRTFSNRIYSWPHTDGSHSGIFCVHNTKSRAEETSDESVLDCHHTPWVMAFLKFTAVNIPNRQLSLAQPLPVITAALVRCVARKWKCKAPRSDTVSIYMINIMSVCGPNWPASVILSSGGYWNVFTTGLKNSTLF